MKKLCMFLTAAALAAAMSFTALADGSLTLTSCTTDGSNVTITSGGAASGSDGNLYLFELKPWEDSIGSRTDYAASFEAGQTTFSLPLLKNSSDSRLNSGFAVAIQNESGYTQVSNVIHITNPEACASTGHYTNAASKKGLQISLSMSNFTGDADDLGVKHAFVNLPITSYMHKSGDSYTIESGGIMNAYDVAIRDLADSGMNVTVQILNPWGSSVNELYRCGQTSGANYYSFDSSTAEGTRALEFLSSYLGKKYKGVVSNWVFGNEVNSAAWYYMGNVDKSTYIKEYERSFRIFYNSIKAENSQARVFVPFDFAWNMEDPGRQPGPVYSVRSFIDEFNSITASGGNIDWGIAYHPYPANMNEPDFWTDSHFTPDNANASVVNFKNLHVLTDYMQNSALLSPSGAVRHIILSEAGFTSLSASRGEVEDLQAAAYAYAYYVAEANPYIEAFILSRQVDSTAERGQGYAFGLWKAASQSEETYPSAQKKIYEVFQKIDTSESSAAAEFAKPLIGIESWGQAIPGCSR